MRTELLTLAVTMCAMPVLAQPSYEQFQGYVNQVEVTQQDDKSFYYQAFVSERLDPQDRGDELVIGTDQQPFFLILLSGSETNEQVEVTYENMDGKVIPRQIKILDRNTAPPRR